MGFPIMADKDRSLFEGIPLFEIPRTRGLSVLGAHQKCSRLRSLVGAAPLLGSFNRLKPGHGLYGNAKRGTLECEGRWCVGLVLPLRP